MGVVENTHLSRFSKLKWGFWTDFDLIKGRVWTHLLVVGYSSLRYKCLELSKRFSKQK